MRDLVNTDATPWIRQTYLDEEFPEENQMDQLTRMSFIEFLYEVGMFDKHMDYEDIEDTDIRKAKQRYLSALSSGIKGNAVIFVKRELKDIFVNGYNKHIIWLHQANMDMQIIIDPHAVVQYMCNYITKCEAGGLRLLKAVDEESHHLNQMEKLNALASALDKSREVSVQEAIYRIQGLPMTKSSVVIKYLSTVHPDFRDGLLKENMEDLDENENIFYNSASDYYMSRPFEL